MTTEVGCYRVGDCSLPRLIIAQQQSLVSLPGSATARRWVLSIVKFGGDALPIPCSLYLVHLRVSATSGQQLVVRTLLHDPTRVEEDDPVGQTGTAQTM